MRRTDSADNAATLDSRHARSTALMRRAEQLGGMGSWEWRPDRDEIVWSDNCYRIFGYEPGEVVPSVERVLEVTHPDDRERLAGAVVALRERGLFPPLDHRIVRPDGSVHELRATMTVVETGEDGAPVIFGTLQDLTEQRRSEREIKAHLAVFEALEAWEDFEPERLLRELGDALSFDVGVLWLPGEGGLRVRAFWRADSLDLERFESETEKLRFARGEGLIGRVWETLEPAILLDLSAVDPHTRRAAAADAGLRGAVVLVARDDDELQAVIELYSTAEVVATDRLRRSLSAIGVELGRFLSRGALAPVALTPREHEILQLAAQGYSGRRIAEQLVVSPATVKTHFEHAYEKLEVSDRASAVAKALRLGLIE